jgi:hypothetical protein
MIRAFLQFSDADLELVFERSNVISATQRESLKELVSVLEDFAFMTTCIQEEQFSIGHVLPMYRGDFLYNLF